MSCGRERVESSDRIKSCFSVPLFLFLPPPFPSPCSFSFLGTTRSMLTDIAFKESNVATITASINTVVCVAKPARCPSAQTVASGCFVVVLAYSLQTSMARRHSFHSSSRSSSSSFAFVVVLALLLRYQVNGCLFLAPLCLCSSFLFAPNSSSGVIVVTQDCKLNFHFSAPNNYLSIESCYYSSK